ncbi:hypothetical protein GGE45_006442 [Rhizobium aethiopicum]|uniref:Uncharacterized protein n=1 Tax=Rhizobium aethiopicum TaxID=1138170 RepID=A0A7W6MJ87_9HYPH|nr:hypothetical protein [Rhizobium aethiopicum]MBB4584059.1 hypothetical protein [Rhizobium aethiopicum]
MRDRKVAACPFAPFTGRRCRQADEGLPSPPRQRRDRVEHAGGIGERGAGVESDRHASASAISPSDAPSSTTFLACTAMQPSQRVVTANDHSLFDSGTAALA